MIQTKLYWESPKENLEMFTQKLSTIRSRPDVIVLPEMFTTRNL